MTQVLTSSVLRTQRGLTLYAEDFEKFYATLKKSGEDVRITCGRTVFSTIDEMLNADPRDLKSGFKFSTRVDFDSISVAFSRSKVEIYSSSDDITQIGIVETLERQLLEHSFNLRRLVSQPYFVPIVWILLILPSWAPLIGHLMGYSEIISEKVSLASAVLSTVYFVNPFWLFRGNILSVNRRYENFADKHSAKLWDVAKLVVGALIGYSIALLQQAQK